jgi:hypothetical protein
VRPELICAETAGEGGCPPCSSPVKGGLCADRWYATGYRCAADGDCAARGGACMQGFCVFADRDRNGVDDALEQEVASRNRPSISLSSDEQCGTPRAVVYRVSRHPANPRRLAISYVVLYDRDCGQVNGHLGDDEAFAITVDLDGKPGPGATVGVLTDAHRNTVCESVSTCETACGTGACAAPGAPVTIYSSKDKHANYFALDECAWTCFDQCDRNPDVPPRMLDVGSADAPLSHDLTADGLLLQSDGWEPELLHFDPWSAGIFGDAGNIADQLSQLVAPAGR